MACLTPLLLKDKLGKVVNVPCGHCINCRKERSKAWGFRLMCECANWQSSVFLTLTYDEEHVTFVHDVSYPFYSTLVPRDLQLFIKRLRKALDGRQIRYYACGEYGTNTLRPHYHAILFGVDFSDLPVIDRCWQMGFVKLDEVNVATCNYVAGYVQKKLYGREVYPDLICPPFSRMSKHLGFDYFAKHHEDIFSHGLHFQGHQIPVPRYFYRLCQEGKIGNYEEWQVIARRAEVAQKMQEKADLDVSRRFGYTEYSDEKGNFRISLDESNRSGAVARETFFKDNRSKI